MIKILVLVWYINKKDVEPVPVTRSTLQGRRNCPLQSERATIDPHADMNTLPP